MWLVIAALVIVADRLTKAAASSYLRHPVRITPFLNLVYFKNSGAAFGVLSSSVGFIRIFLLIFVPLLVSILIVFYLLKRRTDLLTKVALSFILGGALSNVYDRVVYGSVIDFIDFHIGPYHWPAFNLADVAITLGIGLLLLNSYFRAVNRSSF